MSNPVNVDFVTKVVEVEVNDTQKESLAAAAAIASAGKAAEKASAAASSATAAAGSASSASTTATQLMEYLETKETLTAPAVDPTLTISGAAADAKAVRDNVKNLNELISEVLTTDSGSYTATLGNINVNNGANVYNTTDYAHTTYINITKLYNYSLSTDDYYYEVVFCSTNATGNVISHTGWKNGKAKTIINPAYASYIKVRYCIDPEDPSDMTDLLSDLNTKHVLKSYKEVKVDDTLSVSGDAADAAVVGTHINNLDALTEPRENLFYANNVTTDFGITATVDTYGYVKINGTATDTNSIPIIGNKVGTTQHANLEAGTYTFKITALSGTAPSKNALSVRYVYADVTPPYSPVLIVNGNNKEATVTFDAPVIVFLYYYNNSVFTNYKVAVQIEKSDFVGTYSNGGTTDIDYNARVNLAQAGFDLGFSEYKAEVIQNGLIDEAKVTVSKLQKANGRMLQFAYITDTHVFPTAYPNGASFTNNINLFIKASEFVDFCVHGGDVVESGHMVSFGSEDGTISHDTFIRNSTLFYRRMNVVNRPVYICRGNHDCNNYEDSSDQSVVAEAVYNSEFNMLSQPLAGDVITNPLEPHGNYYYKDFEDFKVRVIVLNDYMTDGMSTQSKSSAELAWLFGTALNFTNKTNPSEWGVLIFDHNGKANEMKQGLSQFRKGVDYGTYHYSEQGAIPIIAYIHGNNHADDYQNDILGDGRAKINDIGVDQSFVKSSGDGTVGTTTEYCVDIFTVDTVNRILYETRMGRGSSRKYKYDVDDADNYQIV